MYKPADQNSSVGEYCNEMNYDYNTTGMDGRYTKKEETSRNMHPGTSANIFYEGGESMVTSRRPNVSYAELITMAIESSPDQMLTLKEIYYWISSNYPYFENKKVGWQNSIRHNLSLNRCFYKVPRQEGTRGKGSYWKINYEFQNVKVNYRTRKYTYVPAQQSIHSLTQILNDNSLIGDNIGMNDMSQRKTSIFNGNLRNSDDYVNDTQQQDGYDNTDDNKLDRIFSFK